jgi:hypothetical protein
MKSLWVIPWVIKKVTLFQENVKRMSQCACTGKGVPVRHYFFVEAEGSSAVGKEVGIEFFRAAVLLQGVVFRWGKSLLSPPFPQ